MPGTLSPYRVLSQNTKVLSTTVGPEIALMSIARGRYYSLNPIASQIWMQLANPISVEELTNCAVRDYTGDPERIQSELNGLLGQLMDEGLVEIIPPAQA